MTTIASENLNVTVVVTCAQRRWPLARLLKYYEFYEIDIRVLIVDQSEDRWDQLEYFPNIRYVHLPMSKINFYEMWEEVISKHVKTPYVCWNNDDDFTTPAYLREASSFLDLNPGYSVVSSEHLQFGNGAYGKAEWLREIDAPRMDDVSSRLEFYFNGLLASPHVVVRKEVTINAARCVLRSLERPEASLAPIRFWDKIFTFFALVMGNKKTLRCVGTVRSNRGPQPEREKGTGSIMTILKNYPSILEKDVPYERILARCQKNKLMSSFLESNTPLSGQEAENLIHRIFNMPLGAGRNRVLKKTRELPSNSRQGKMEIQRIEEFIRAHSLSK